MRAWNSPRIRSAASTLADQGIVSLGTFIATLVIARTLTPADYGVFSLLVLGGLWLQVITGSLLFYPLAVRGTVLTLAERRRLFVTGLVLLIVFCALLCPLLVTVLMVLGRRELIGPAIGWFTLWQVQELMRRGLLTEMRHEAAIPGDAVSYLGRGLLLVLLMRWQALTLGHALFAMAVASALAAVLQAAQLRLGRYRPHAPLPVLALCWKIGGFSLGSNLLASAPMQILPWALAATGGTALTAAYQASGNLIQLTNPVILGLCNIIPQAAARQRVSMGCQGAWQAARGYALLGAVPVFAYYGLLLAAAKPMLHGFYGAASPYGAEGGLVRLMAVAALTAYGADMICSYLHGIESPRLAAGINLRGVAVALVLALPLALFYGTTGAGIGLIAVALARLVTAQSTLSRTRTGAAYA